MKSQRHITDSWTLYRALGPITSSLPVRIQLPDNSEPVEFTVLIDGDGVTLFPIPPDPSQVWDHDTNVITASTPPAFALNRTDTKS
jgi:hypothetical protein